MPAKISQKILHLTSLLWFVIISQRVQLQIDFLEGTQMLKEQIKAEIPFVNLNSPADGAHLGSGSLTAVRMVI